MPTSQNNKYKNIIHSQKLLLSNKDETISLLNERIEKLETQKELNELKQRIGELKKQNKQYEKDVIIKSNRLMDMIHKFDKQEKRIDELKYKFKYMDDSHDNLEKVCNELAWKVARHEQQYSKLTNKMLHIPPLFIATQLQGEIVHKLLLTMRENVEKSKTKIIEFEKEEIEE